MWLIQNGTVVRVPDDAPRPPGAVVVEPPADFLTAPHTYRIGKRTLTRRTEAELAAQQQQMAAATLTPEEVRALKQALASGRLGSVSSGPAPEQEGPSG
jgi:hypothetical protein